jgi:hypothetical protein
MNFRALSLLAAVLLIQLGQGLMLAEGPEKSEGHAASCGMECCAWMKECLCVETPGSTSAPQTPAPAPPSGRDLVPQPVMAVDTSSDPTNLSARNSDDARSHPVAPRMIAVAAVRLTVLHCAFLI